eukprot:scaffold1735_cov119-Isochrysis_galbana.AAC.16
MRYTLTENSKIRCGACVGCLSAAVCRSVWFLAEQTSINGRASCLPAQRSAGAGQLGSAQGEGVANR